MPEQDPPPIEPGRGRLRYDKAQRTIVAEDAQACAADPPEVVLERLFDINRAKSEGEHMAVRVIEAMAHRLSCPFDRCDRCTADDRLLKLTWHALPAWRR